MKILTTMAGENTWEDLNLRQSLKNMGHEVVDCGVNKKTINKITEMDNKPDLWYMVSAGPHEGQSQEIVNEFADNMKKLKELNIPSVYFSAGAGCGFIQMDSLSAPHIEYAVTTDRISIDYFKQYKTPNVIYSCFAANPDVYKKKDLPYNYDVSFVGTAFGHRHEQTIPNLLNNDIDVRVWGDFWRDEERPGYIGDKRVNNIAGSKVPIPYMVDIFNKTKINLCFSIGFHIDNFRGYAPRTMKLRHFEITASGGFMLTDWHHDYELEEFFKPGVEVETYDTEAELVDKISYYLKHEDEREKIAQAGYERCINEHTWENRFNDIFEKMGLK
jgi:hypothetical protein